MAFQFFQIPEHQTSTGNPPTLTNKWKAIGSTSQSFVQAYAFTATPNIVATNYGTLYRQDLRISQVAYNQFDVEIPYAKRKNQTGEWSWEFDTTGGNVHITNSKQTVNRYPATAPDQKGAIGVEGDQVKGTDIVIPAMKINVTYKHPTGVITLAQAKFINSLTGKVNSTPFLTFSPGEVLFLGGRGSDGTTSESTVGYQFAMSANAAGLTIGDVVGVVKKGWDAIWVRYEDQDVVVGSDTKNVRVPAYAYVERVYDTVDLAASLGFGG